VSPSVNSGVPRPVNTVARDSGVPRLLESRRSLGKKKRNPTSSGRTMSSKQRPIKSKSSSSPVAVSTLARHESAPVTVAPPLADVPMKSPELKRLRKTSSELSGQSPPSGGIFREEDKLVKAHREHIDQYMLLIKQDMKLLKKIRPFYDCGYPGLREGDEDAHSTESQINRRTVEHLVKFSKPQWYCGPARIA